jgi:hypothetical protein
MSESTEDRLAKAIDEAKSAAQASIDAYAGLAKEAAAQLSGDSPGDTGEWLQLTTRTYTQAARDTVQAWTTYVAVLQALAESSGTGAESRDSKGSGPES